jgi:hypothetical protein
MPPALDDVVLIAAVDGEAGTDITAHLRACQHCAERARDFAELQGLLRKQFYRMFCPTSDNLAALQQGLLNGERRAALLEHLAACPHCTRELHMLAQATNEPVGGWPPTSSPWLGLSAEAPSARSLYSRARRVVAELLSRPQMQLAGVYGALRGTSHASQYAYRAENLQITLGVQSVVNRPDRRALLGALTLEDDLGQELSSATARLLRNDILISAADLDDLGNFVLDNLAPGTYSLSLLLPDREVVVESLSL